MTKPQVKVEGAKQLRSAMKKAGLDLKDMNELHKRVAAIAGAAGQAGAPVRTGALRDTVRWSGTRTYAVVRAGKARVPYAGVIHFGWPAHGIEANPWITRAAQQTEPQWYAVYERGIDKLLDDVADSTRGVHV